jgi:hypothetical protein
MILPSKAGLCLKTADGQPQKVAARRAFSVLYGGKALVSLIDPVKQAEKLIASFLPVKERTLYLCTSPLFGYGLDTLIENLNATSSNLLCVETDCKLYDWTLENAEFSQKDKIVCTQDPIELCRIVRGLWGSRCFRRVEVIRLTEGYSLASSLYDLLANTLRREIRIEWGNAITLSKLGRLYSRNAIRNIPLLAKSRLPVNLGSRPVLVAGAGPSLDGFFDFLGKKMPDIAIICADTALLPLFQRGIKPKLVVALEAQHWNLNDFIGAGRPPLAIDLSALPATALMGDSPLSGKIGIFWTEWTELRLFDRLKQSGLLPINIPPLGSVGLSAVSLALKLTSGDIITAGLDFSFTSCNYHCRGSPGHLRLLRTASRIKSIYPPIKKSAVKAIAKSGEQVYTDASLKNYRELFETELSCNKRLFDINGSGLSLGIKTLNFEEALAKLSENAGDVGGAINVNDANDAGDVNDANDAGDANEKILKLKKFIEKEKNILSELLSILKGEQSGENLDNLLEAADYLWAHFPDCAACGGLHPTDISFLKRVRAEIEPFLRLWQKAEEGLT